MDYISNIEFIQKEYKNTNTDIHKMVDQMRSEIRDFSDSFTDDYNKMTDWGHKYFCEEDGGILKYDRANPNSHICTICGTEYKSDELDRVWTYFYRNEAISTAQKAAAVYKVSGEEKYLEDVIKLIGYYAENYTNFVIHARDTAMEITNTGKLGYARIMPQELNEAIIATKIANILETVKEDLPKEFIEMVNTKMFKEIYTILAPQANKVHNKPCWSICAIGVMGLFAGDQEMIDYAFESEFNINKQLLEGVTEAHMWYEGSMLYNFFTLEGIIALLHFSKLYNKECEIIETTVENMLNAAYEYAFDNLIFPNPNDGWPDISLKTFSFVYHLAYKIYGEEKMGALLRTIEASELERKDPQLARPYYYANKLSMEELLFNADFDKSGDTLPSKGSINFESSNVGILKNEKVNVFLKYGHMAKSHAHADKMNIEITLKDKLISRDLSNSGYVSRLCNEWHRATPSHNTISVNGMNQTSIAKGDILNFTDNTLEVKSNNVYDETENNVDFTRKIELNENSFNDLFTITSEEEVNLDCFYHFEADVKLITVLNTDNADFGYSANGYQHISEVKKVNCDADSLNLMWDIDDIIFTTKFDTANKEIFICKTMDNPVNKHRTTVVLREKAKETTFNSVWSL